MNPITCESVNFASMQNKPYGAPTFHTRADYKHTGVVKFVNWPDVKMESTGAHIRDAVLNKLTAV